MNQTVRRRLSRIALPILRRAASSYIAGPELSDALAVAKALSARGSSTTVAYWDESGTNTGDVLSAYLEAALALQNSSLDCYLSVKAPSLAYSHSAMLRVAECCQRGHRRLHFDSLGIDSAEPTRALVAGLLKQYNNLSFTLPGRWMRSLDDADWAVENGIGVRVVKGQWPDIAAADRDPVEGFLAVIEKLAGRARHVAVATHNPKLAAVALERLRRAGTPCELELLFGLPSVAALNTAATIGVRTRVYVPYGYGWLPYSLSQARQNPRILWWMLKDAMNRKPTAGA